MIKISPSVLAADFANLGSMVKLADESGARLLHLDVMDGSFVPNISFGADVIKSLRKYSDIIFDVHLMIDNPERYIKNFADAGADIITVHAEATKHLNRCIQLIHSFNLKAGVALCPATPLCAVEEVLDDVELVLIMSVNPGFGGQKYIPSSTDKIARLKKMIGGRDIMLEVDGGISVDNINEITRAGADTIVVGTTFYKSENPKKTVEMLIENSFGD